VPDQERRRRRVGIQVRYDAQVLLSVLDCGCGVRQLRPHPRGQHGKEDEVRLNLL